MHGAVADYCRHSLQCLPFKKLGLAAAVCRVCMHNNTGAAMLVLGQIFKRHVSQKLNSHVPELTGTDAFRAAAVNALAVTVLMDSAIRFT